MEDDLYVNLELTKVCRHPSGIVNSAKKFKDEENGRSSHPSEIDCRDLQPPKPSTPHIQEAEPKTGRTVKIISTVLTITLVVTLVISLILVTANYFQMQIYLKDVDKETRKMIDSFQLQNSSFLSERDLAGFHILGHLSMLQTAVHMLKPKEETASRDQSLLQGLKKIVSLPENTWRWNNSNLYYFSNETRNWNESETFCRSYNAHLSSVLTAEEQAYLRSMKGSGGYWIGLTDAESEGNWTFVDGSGLKLRFWAKDQPDNWRGMEDCGHLTVYGDWNDDECEQQYKWICKMSLTE